VIWDLTAENGREAANGVYFLRVREGNKEAVKKIAIVR